MKTLRSIIFALSLLLVVSAAHAQSGRVSARIPFDFIVSNHLYPAGDYMLTPDGMSNPGVIIWNTDDQKAGLVLTTSCEKSARAEKTVLVFQRHGDQYFLDRVWIEGNTRGRQFPKGKIETQLARNHQDGEEVIVAGLVTR